MNGLFQAGLKIGDLSVSALRTDQVHSCYVEALAAAAVEDDITQIPAIHIASTKDQRDGGSIALAIRPHFRSKDDFRRQVPIGQGDILREANRVLQSRAGIFRMQVA